MVHIQGPMNQFQFCINTCNVGAFNVSLSILGFRVVCATCGRQVQHPEFRLARSKWVEVTRGARFDRSGNFTETFLCFLYGDVPVKPICGGLMKLLFTNTYEFLATKAPKRQIGLPTVVKITCSPLPFFSLSLMVSSKGVKALSLK